MKSSHRASRRKASVHYYRDDEDTQPAASRRKKKNNTQGGGRGGREGDATPTFSRSPSGARLWKQFLARHAWIKVDKLVSWCARLFLVTSN